MHANIAGLFYYMLGNVDPKYRSRIDNIHLVTIVRTTLIQKYGMNKILEPFIEEIKMLERVSHHIFIQWNFSLRPLLKHDV